MPHSTVFTQYPLTRSILSVGREYLRPLRDTILRGWGSACRHAERPDRVVPYY